MTSKPSAFKHWINAEVVEAIAAEIHAVYPNFNRKEFAKVAEELAALELKARVLAVAAALAQHLPKAYPEALRILEEVMARDRLQGFALWPFSEFIGQRGLGHVPQSLRAMLLLTQKFTAEFAVRPFFLSDPAPVLAAFREFATHESHHVRRWVSEGSRPLLPWGAKLPGFIERPELTLELLDLLRYDDELYVRKSVANHLNDVSKHHPKLVVQTLAAWQKACPPEHALKIAWITRQALRTLIKKGDPAALRLLGVRADAQVKVRGFALRKKLLRIGENLEFSFVLRSTAKKPQRLVVDYVLHFRRAKGSLGKKVFKLKTLELAAGETLEIRKSHSLKPITTMRYYPGEQRVSLQINGKSGRAKIFKLRD